MSLLSGNAISERKQVPADADEDSYDLLHMLDCSFAAIAGLPVKGSGQEVPIQLAPVTRTSLWKYQ